MTEWPWQRGSSVVYFGLFSLRISPTILCYVGNGGKRQRFMMLKPRGSSDLVSIIMRTTKDWPEAVCINASVLRHGDGFCFLPSRAGTEQPPFFSFAQWQLAEGKRPKAAASPDGEDSSGGLQKEGAKWVTSTTGKAWNRSKSLFLSGHTWEAFQLKTRYILKWERGWHCSGFRKSAQTSSM